MNCIDSDSSEQRLPEYMSQQTTESAMCCYHYVILDLPTVMHFMFILYIKMMTHYKSNEVFPICLDRYKTNTVCIKMNVCQLILG